MESSATNRLSGKRMLLLGGSSGIGLATAKAAAAAGAEVVIVSQNASRLATALQQLPEGTESYSVDLGNTAAIEHFFQQVAPFDHLIYTAGENISLSEIDATEVDYARQYFNIRYWGAYAALKYGHKLIRPGGSIVLTGGIASQRPGKGWSLGASICAAMEGLTRAMAVELAPLRVNLISPGVVKTSLWNSMSEADREGLYSATAAQLPVQRVGEAEDIAATFIYLMNQPYCTGQVLTVDGGAVLV